MRHTLLLFTLVMAAPAAAQMTPLTLGRALELARANSPALQAATGRVAAAAGAARERAVPANPSLELRREHWSSPLERDQFATLSLPLDVAGRRVALRAAGREEVAAVEADASAVRLDIEAEVAASYYAAVLADALADASATQVRALEGIAAFEAVRWREGAVAEAVALRTHLEAERAGLELGRARAEAVRARAALARAIGLMPDELPPVMLPESSSPLAVPPTIEAALALARERRPEIVSARRRVAASVRVVGAEQRAAVPDVTFEIGAKRTSGYTTGVFAVSIGLPVFDRRAGARQRARGEQQIAEAELRAVEQRVASEVAAALGAWERLLGARTGAAATLAAQGFEVAAIAEAAYREGAISLLELLDAERAYADARAEAARWSADLATARIALNRALGAPIDEGL